MRKSLPGALLLVAILAVPFAAWGCGGSAPRGDPRLAEAPATEPAHWGPPGFEGGPPQQGQLLPPFLEDQLSLTAEQKKQLAELQKEADGKLDKILTDEQRKQLRQMQQGFGPGGPPG